MNRLHNTARELRINSAVIMQNPGMKPRGLWYAIDGEWLDWCRSEMPHWVHKHTYALELDMAKILVVKERDLDAFIKQYKSNARYNLPTLGDDFCMEIDWAKIAESYSGVEMQDYHHGYEQNRMWYGGWDCSSGCVWDASVIKTVKEVVAWNTQTCSK